MLTVKKTVGNSEITYTSDGKDLKEDIVKITWLSNSPDKCGLCDSPNIALQGRVTKEGEFIYAEFVCKDCWAKATLGEYKHPKSALFIKKWEKYERQVQKEEIEG